MEINIQRKLIKTEEEFNEVINFISNCQIISIDTENGGDENSKQALNPKYCIPAGYSVCVKKDKTYYSYYFPLNHSDIKTDFNEKLKSLMKNKKIIIMHNSCYDGSVFKCHYDYDLQDLFWFDTAVGQHLIDEVNPKGLKKLTKRYLGISQTEYNFGDISKHSSENVYKYACDDAVYTYMHYERQKQQLKEEQLLDLYKKIEEPFQKVLVHMKCNGVTFNIDKCKEVEKQLIEDKKKAIDNIIKVTPQISTTTSLFNTDKKLNFNLSSADDLKKLLYDKLNLPILGKTESGAPAVDTPTLRKIIDEHPCIKYIIEYKEIEKLLSSYTHSLYKKVWEGKIYPDFNNVGTKTSRLSSENPNFQNLPNNSKYKIRSFFESSKGYKMYVADFSQEELRVCGVITNSDTFKKAFNEGQDLHLRVARDIWNLDIPEECLVGTHKDYSYYKDKYSKERKNAKFVGFGLMYGRTAHGLQGQLGGTVEENQLIVDEYFKTYPEILNEIEKTKKDIQSKGFTRNLYNRKRRFSKFQGKYYTNNVFRQGFNYKIQGSCGDILRIVMNNIMDYINELDNDEVRIIGTVHDEVLYEIKDNDNFETHKNKIKYIMENSVKLSIPLTVDGEVGYNYMECK